MHTRQPIVIVTTLALLVFQGQARSVTGTLEQPGAEPSKHATAASQGTAHEAAPISADELLTKLEQADAGLTRLSASITRVKDFAIAGDRQVWRGELYFAIDPPTASGPGLRRFFVRFDSQEVGSRRQDRSQQYIFDGRTLVERLPEEKLQTEREIVGPGETFDPMRVGEGPLPIPIGQKKADILSKYDATMLEPADGLDASAEASLIPFTKDTYQIKLVPKGAGDSEDEFKEIRLWYRKDSLLPALARTVNQSEDVDTVKLVDPKRNSEAALTDDVLSTALPEGWKRQRVEWRGRGGGTPEGAGDGSEPQRVEFEATTPGPVVKPAAPVSPSNPR